ncbi:MAG: TetR/AcrR family transcriptional regulator, partial [Kiritimatiellaeota bacterium]|nr:TetR/AcrR family transcriptional regulator [Kiritimatiellota bacterium]
MPGRPPDPLKRERILTAAIALFLKRGYHDTSTAAIARRAGMSSSHMYIYFKDKEDLLHEAVCRMKDEHTALSTRLAKKSAGLDDEQFIELFYKAQKSIRHRVRFIAHCTVAPGTSKLFEGM